MDIRTLRYFVEVVRQQSLTCVAEKLFITQPTISKMLENLEDELNCMLLIRNGRRLLLTDVGHAVFEYELTLLVKFRQLEAELSDIDQLKTGVLRLGIPLMVGTLTAGSIGLFRQRYPGVGLKISEFGDLMVQQAAMNNELDMILTALPIEEGGLTTLSLFSHPLCVPTPHLGRWLKCDAVSPETSAKHPLLIYDEDSTLSKQSMKLFDECGAKPRVVVHGGQWNFLITMVQADVRIAILPEPICRRLDKNTLKWLPLKSKLD